MPKQKSNIAILLASARKHGHSAQIASICSNELDATIFDILDYRIPHFNYNQEYVDDQFHNLLDALLEYDTWLLITPVYWYSMSAQLKVFVDRITDCLTSHKAKGRKLSAKSLAVITCGSDDSKTPGFFVPFRMSAEYLSMQYLGDHHTWIDAEIRAEEKKALEQFNNQLKLQLQ